LCSARGLPPQPGEANPRGSFGGLLSPAHDASRSLAPRVWHLPNKCKGTCHVVGACGVLLLWIAVRRSGWILHPHWRLLFVVLLLCGAAMTSSCGMVGPMQPRCSLRQHSLVNLPGEKPGANGLCSFWVHWPSGGAPVGCLCDGCLVRWFPSGSAPCVEFCIICSYWIGRWLRALADHVRNTKVSHSGSLRLHWDLVAQWSVKWLSWLCLEIRSLSTGRDETTAILGVLARVLRDPSYIWCMVSIVVALLWLGNGNVCGCVLPWYFCLAAALAVPIIIFFAAYYTPYYGWMGFLIAAFGALAAISSFWASCGSLPRFLALAPVIIACLIGFQNALSSYNACAYQPWRCQDFIRKNLSPSEVAWVDQVAYYTAVAYLQEAFVSSYAGGRGYKEVSPEQQSKIGVMVIRPVDLEKCVKKLGGQWIPGPRYQSASGLIPSVLG